MVFGIVKGHGGGILVCSEPRRGTLLRVYLPAASEADRVTEVGEESSLGLALPRGTGLERDLDTPSASEGGGRLFLVVDDEELIRTVAGAVLEGSGFRVLTAADGEEALATYRGRLDAAGHSDIDLILLDYTMPGRTGLEILQELRELNPAVRVVFSTGYALDSTGAQLLAAGARGFVPKPYRPHELLQTVREVLGS
jgi:CheY-like chemotaxis protein